MDEIDAVVSLIAESELDLASELYSALSDEDFVERSEENLSEVLDNLKRYVVLDLLIEG